MARLWCFIDKTRKHCKNIPQCSQKADCECKHVIKVDCWLANITVNCWHNKSKKGYVLFGMTVPSQRAEKIRRKGDRFTWMGMRRSGEKVTDSHEFSRDGSKKNGKDIKKKMRSDDHVSAIRQLRYVTWHLKTTEKLKMLRMKTVSQQQSALQQICTQHSQYSKAMCYSAEYNWHGSI